MLLVMVFFSLFVALAVLLIVPLQSIVLDLHLKIKVMKNIDKEK